MGRQEVGGRAAAPVWLYFMEKVLKDKPVESFPVPEGIVFIKVNAKTGLRVQTEGPGIIDECFLDTAMPGEKDETKPDETEELFR